MGKLRLPDVATPLFLRHGSSDYDTLSQIFFRRAYDSRRFAAYEAWSQRAYERTLASSRQPLIVDAGANAGFSSIWFAARYPGAVIYALEPDDENFRALRTNVEGAKNIVPLHAAIWDRTAAVGVIDTTAPAWARQVVEAAASDAASKPAHSMADIMKMASASEIFIAKIDIEGSERELFRSNTDWMDATCIIMIELHDPWAPGTQISRGFLRELSRRQFDIVWQGETMFCFAAPPGER